METLDLHGIRHREAERLVENFILLQEMPVRIVTGNSPAMVSIVKDVLDNHGFQGEPESFWNLGSLIICAKSS